TTTKPHANKASISGCIHKCVRQRSYIAYKKNQPNALNNITRSDGTKMTTPIMELLANRKRKKVNI
ncbi:30009_t:CDS:1, partial [Racocetra persica]